MNNYKLRISVSANQDFPNNFVKTTIYFQNKLYYDGLKSAIQLKRDLGQPVHVLDIGMFLSII